MFVLTKLGQYYNFEKERWENDYKLATVLVDKGSKRDGDEFRWVIVKSFCPGPLTIIFDKQTGISTEMPYCIDTISRIKWENSTERKEKEQKRTSQLIAKERAIELANLIKEDNGPTRDYGFELAELVLFLTS